ncbi:MAG: hypothetical protein ACREP9_18305 [Candidatus Dormibacteraceae bacterium]
MEHLAREGRPVWLALLNALVAEAENLPVRDSVVRGIRDALVACSTYGATMTGNLLDEQISTLVSAVSSPAGRPRGAIQKQGEKAPKDRDLAQGEAELEAVESLLVEQFPMDSTACAGLLNALVLEGETRRPRKEVVDGLVQGLSALRGPNFLVSGVVFQLVRPLLKALALPLRGDPKVWDRYSFGPQMTHLVLYLRNALGLSKLYVYRYLRYEMDIRMPSDALIRCVSLVWSRDEIAPTMARFEPKTG